MKEIDDKIELIVSDNGIGVPADFNLENTDTLGLELVHNLVNQIDGTITMDTDHGTEFKIIFNELKYKKRM